MILSVPLKNTQLFLPYKPSPIPAAIGVSSFPIWKWLSWRMTTWKTLVDMNLRAFKGSIKKIRDCAGVIDRLNRSELIYHMSIEAKDARFVGIHESPTLPVRLREYADKLDWLRHVFGPKRNIRLNAWRGWIVAVVMENTEKPHDREVSSLIAAVLNDSQYSESAHRAWRSKHIDVIDAMRKTLKEHRREKHPSHS